MSKLRVNFFLSYLSHQKLIFKTVHHTEL